MSPPKSSTRRGISRADLLVCVLVAGIAIGVAIVALRGLRDDSFEYTTSQLVLNEFRQVSLACSMFYHVHKRFPPAFDKAGAMNFPASVHVHLLPFIDLEKMYQEFLRAGKVDENAQITLYTGPSLRKREDGRGVQCIAANLRVFSDKGVNTPFDGRMPALGAIEPGSATIKGTIKDGASYTMLFATKHAYCGEGGSRFAAAPNSPFAAFFGENAASVKAHPSDPGATFQLLPSRQECLTTPLMAQSFWPAAMPIGMADGSARRIFSDISPRTWNSALQPNDGNKLGDDWWNE